MTTPNIEELLKLADTYADCALRAATGRTNRPEAIAVEARAALTNALQSQAERIAELEDQITELTSEENSIPELRQMIDDSYAEKQKCYFALSQHQLTYTNLLTERDTLRAQIAAIDATEPVNESLAEDIEALDVMYRGDPSYEHDGYYIKTQAAKLVRKGCELFTRPRPAQRLTELKLLMLTIAYEQGVGKGIQRRDCNPYAADTDEHAAWKLGYEEGVDKPMPAQGVGASIINLPEPVAWLANYGGNVYTEAQLKQAVRDALDALKDVAQTLAWTQHGECRGFSDGLLTTDEALDKARDALSKYKGGKA